MNKGEITLVYSTRNILFFVAEINKFTKICICYLQDCTLKPRGKRLCKLINTLKLTHTRIHTGTRTLGHIKQAGERASERARRDKQSNLFALKFVAFCTLPLLRGRRILGESLNSPHTQSHTHWNSSKQHTHSHAIRRRKRTFLVTNEMANNFWHSCSHVPHTRTICDAIGFSKLR